MKGFQLKFIFAANPYFENEFLTKKYELKVDNNQSITLNAIGYFLFLCCTDFTQQCFCSVIFLIKFGVSFRTEINWYPSKNLTENDESFFNFFDTITYHNRVYFDEEAVSWDSFMVTSQFIQF